MNYLNQKRKLNVKERVVFEPIKSLNIHVGDRHIGRMALSSDRLCAFEYSDQFLLDGFAISPFYLPLRPGLQISHRDPFDGLFGIFNDSLPDGWGHLLIDRYLVSQGIQPQALSVLDRLSLVGTTGMGALEFRPDNRVRSGQLTNDIEFLAKEVNHILSEVEYSEGLQVLVEQGGSSGGARPKALINIDDIPWIVKFAAPMDPSNIGAIEYQYSLIAKKCGIEMPDTALLEDKYFGIRRFDRSGGSKIHIHSASGLLYASHRFPSLDYSDLIKASYALTKNLEEAYKIFRLMIFNVLTGNKDDHAKNFSFCYENDEWRFAPAYDLVPSDGFNGNHSTTIATKGQPDLKDIMTVAQECGLNNKKARGIFDEVYSNCSEIKQVNW